jgi:hypothetical protein
MPTMELTKEQIELTCSSLKSRAEECELAILHYEQHDRCSPTTRSALQAQMQRCRDLKTLLEGATNGVSV